MNNKAVYYIFKLLYVYLFVYSVFIFLPRLTYADVPPDLSSSVVSPTQKTSIEEHKKEQIIESIEINGLKNINYQTVLNKLQSKKGDIFSIRVLEEDIRRLYEANLFSKIDWKTEQILQGEKIKIILTVEESAMVAEIKFEGAENISENILKQDLKIKAGLPLNTLLLKSDSQLMAERYLEKGYYFVSVNYSVDDGPKGKIITHTIREGPCVKIKKIIFNGNKSFPPERTWLFFSKIPLYNYMKQDSGYYHEKELMLDIERLKKLYRDKGWLDVNVFIEDIFFNEIKDRVFITIHIDEGEQYKIGKITICDNKVISTSEISTKVKIKEDSMYEMEVILNDINSIKTLYGKLGYIDCDVQIKTYFPITPAVVDLTYQIIEGNPNYLEKVKIIGNDKTKDKVIRREMLIYPGDLMEYGLIRDSLDRIGSTRYFKDLNYEIEDGSAPGLKNIVIKLTETTTGMMNFGGGYSSNYGLTGIIELNQINFDLANPPKSFGGFFSGKSFAGGGQQLRLVLQPGITTSQYGIFFTEPYVFNKPVELNFNLFGSERSWDEYYEDSDNIGFTLAYRFWKKWKIGMGPNIEQINISRIESTAPITIKELKGDNILQSFTVFIENDTRDRWFIPHSGYRCRYSEEYAGGFLNGNFNYTKSTLSTEAYQPLLTLPDDKKIILNLNSKIAQVEHFGDSTSVPFFERFYAGGFGSVRGFRFRTISPKQNDDAVGGKIMSTFNSEITCPLYTEEMAGRPMEIVRAAIFYDAGNVVDSWDELKWKTARSSFGWGFRFQLGMIPVSLDFASPIRKQPGDETQHLTLNLGFGF
ncbi:MAG: outer membrane protein assembly factor BamA [Planctomycetota bacterium]